MPTVAPFHAYTFQLKSEYALDKATSAVFSGRYFDERQESFYLLSGEDAEQTVDEKGMSRDFNLSASVRHRFSRSTEAVARLYHTGYRTASDVVYRENGEFYDATFFDQHFLRPEVQVNHRHSDHLRFTGGAGWVSESVEATRFSEKKKFQSGYLFLHAEWSPVEKVHLIACGRFYTHRSEEHTSALPSLIRISYAVFC